MALVSGAAISPSWFRRGTDVLDAEPDKVSFCVCRDCDPRLTKIFLDVSERHYPERLAEFINVSTPSVFSMLWRAIEGWVDPVTRAKVKFVG